ncbi:thioredoxin family protein [Paenibacillus rigui]|uniref:Thiol reductase thioredoxin n=1 Tax=Paenibacillus rigui TaxID=554312 RepID=A0A229UWP2_9BACL|nr:thioredoxin family protein [Paenibacillus rigui]OXM87872.1 thiol reductase thioredoxin [Paenibacillus rigui]
MEEWTEQQLSRWMNEEEGLKFVYLYTPLCGTCKVTERMLQVVIAMQPELPIVKCNVNFCPTLARSWQVESVPCIVRAENRQLIEKKYRMQGVDELLRWFQRAIS